MISRQFRSVSGIASSSFHVGCIRNLPVSRGRPSTEFSVRLYSCRAHQTKLSDKRRLTCQHPDYDPNSTTKCNDSVESTGFGQKLQKVAQRIAAGSNLHHLMNFVVLGDRQHRESMRKGCMRMQLQN